MDKVRRRRAMLWIFAAVAIVASAAVMPIADSYAESSAPNSVEENSRREKADADRARELVALGDRLAKGKDVPRDEAEAVRLYQGAAELGDLTGKTRLGQALIYGRGTSVDLPRGLKLIREAVDGGNAAAMVLLSDLIFKGLAGTEDRTRGVELLEAAAAKGQMVALVKLGEIYELGVSGKKDPRKAATFYRKAIAAGRTDAMVAMGRMYVEGRSQGLGSPADGVALLRRARELGNENAVLALSECYFRGQGVARDPRKALSLLEEAWKAGNTKAGMKLLALYRDGRKGSVRANLSRARVYLGALSERLPAHELNSEALLLKAKLARTKSARSAVVREFSQVSISDRAALLRRIRSSNLNLYVSLVQVELKRLGLFKREQTGLLSRETVSAIYNHCLRHEAPIVCKKGPLTPRVVEVTALAFQGNLADAAKKRTSAGESDPREVEKARLLKEPRAVRAAKMVGPSKKVRTVSVAKGKRKFVVYGAAEGSDLASPR